jgi:DNA-binding MarR family transcriptional regulator
MPVQPADITGISYHIIEFYNKISSWEQDVAKDSGLSTPQMHTVEIVGRNVSLRMKELATKMGITTGSLTVMIDRLAEQGFVRRTPHETDRRSWLIELTDKGQLIFARHHQHHLQLTEEITAVLSAEEQRLFAGLLKKIVSQM